MAERLLILGASGFVGRYVRSAVEPGRALGTYGRSAFEGGAHFDPLSMRIGDILGAEKGFSHAIILFAESKPDPCFRDPDTTRKINVDCLKTLVPDLLDRGIKPIFTSTEMVFDGEKGNYTEEDEANPVLAYGAQKLEAERYLQSLGEPLTIVRLAKVFGNLPEEGTLFAHWADQMVEQRPKHMRIAEDQAFSPVHGGDVADALVRAAELDLDGIFHLAGDQRKSRIELFRMVVNELRKYTEVEIEIEPCSIKDFDLPEPRPLDLSLDCSKLIGAGALSNRNLDEACSAIVEQRAKIGLQ